MKLPSAPINAAILAAVSLVASGVQAASVATTYDSYSQRFVLPYDAENALWSAQSNLDVSNSPVVWNTNPLRRTDGAWAGQCVAFVKEVRSDLNRSWGGVAKKALTTFSSSHQIDQMPQVGAAFVWPSGSTGHTGIVTAVRPYTANGTKMFGVYYSDSNRKYDERYLSNGYIALKVSTGSSGWKFIHDTKSNFSNRKSAFRSAIKSLYDAGFLSETNQGSYITASTYSNDAELLALMTAGSDNAAKRLCEVVRAFVEELNRGPNPSDLKDYLIERLNNQDDSNIRNWMKQSQEWQTVRANLGGDNGGSGQFTTKEKMGRLFDALENSYPGYFPASGRTADSWIDENTAYRCYSNGNFQYIWHGNFWYYINNSWTDSGQNWTDWYSGWVEN